MPCISNPFWILAKDTAQEGQLRGSHGPVPQITLMAGTHLATYTRERPGVSVFVLEDGVVYHTYCDHSSRCGRPQSAQRTGVWRIVAGQERGNLRSLGRLLYAFKNQFDAPKRASS